MMPAPFCMQKSTQHQTTMQVHLVRLINQLRLVAYQSQLIKLIGNHSNTVEYTIASSTPDNLIMTNVSWLLLTASP